ncbi:MAG: dTDP-4-dehydrorhamnose reductase [Candidatus Aminicenantes bacterium]|nr:dTDP-4-dehydrorhamnose reductase [Candidatus Aminicenantes bacterium]
MKTKIAIIGADGQLGSDLVKSLQEHRIFPLYYPDFDITKPDQARKALSRLKAEVVINTAAYNRVDEAEDNPQEAFRVNSIAVRDMALICRDLDSVLVHFSTDYVFDGQKKDPYTEEDLPSPLNVYAISKLEGEHFVQNILDKYFVIRTCGLYGEAGCWGKGSNFVDTLVALEKEGKPLRVVNDQRITPTATAELAERVKELIGTDQYGLYHLSNEGDCTWYEFAQAIFSLMDKKPDIIPVDSKSYGAKAERPPYSVLDNKRAREIGLTEFTPWKDALKRYLIRKKYIKS